MSRPRTSTPKRIRRDIRVDRIGFVGELVKHYIDGDNGIKPALKRAMRVGSRRQGEFFAALLCADSCSQVDVKGLLLLYEKGVIPRKAFLDCISASAPAVRKLNVHPRRIGRLIKTMPATPRLIVERIKGRDVSLTQAIIALHEAIEEAADDRTCIGPGTAAPAKGAT